MPLRSSSQQTEESRNIESAAIAVVQDVAREIHPDRTLQMEASLSDRLDEDLGIDSLGRSEQQFHVHISEEKIFGAKTVEDIVDMVSAAEPRRAPSALPDRVSPGLHEAGKERKPAHRAKTLIEILSMHAEATPDYKYLLLLDDKGEEKGLTYAALMTGAQKVATGIQSLLGNVENRPIAIMLPTSHDFFTSFFGVLFAGGIPVPLYPPYRLEDIEDHLKRQIHILSNAEAPLLITSPEALKWKNVVQSLCPTLREVSEVQVLSRSGDLREPINRVGNDIALLQFD